GSLLMRMVVEESFEEQQGAAGGNHHEGELGLDGWPQAARSEKSQGDPGAGNQADGKLLDGGIRGTVLPNGCRDDRQPVEDRQDEEGITDTVEPWRGHRHQSREFLDQGDGTGTTAREAPKRSPRPRRMGRGPTAFSLRVCSGRGGLVGVPALAGLGGEKTG